MKCLAVKNNRSTLSKNKYSNWLLFRIAQSNSFAIGQVCHMTKQFSRIFELNLSISLLQLQLRAPVSLLHIKMDKRKQEFSDDEDFETPDAGGNTNKKPKMHEGAAAAFL